MTSWWSHYTKSWTSPTALHEPRKLNARSRNLNIVLYDLTWTVLDVALSSSARQTELISSSSFRVYDIMSKNAERLAETHGRRDRSLSVTERTKLAYNVTHELLRPSVCRASGLPGLWRDSLSVQRRCSVFRNTGDSMLRYFVTLSVWNTVFDFSEWLDLRFTHRFYRAIELC